MAGVADQALDIDAVAAEGGHRLGLAARIGFLQLAGVIDDAHAAAAAAGDRLDHDGAAGALRREEGPGLLQAGRPAGAFDDRHAASFCQRLGLRLVAEQLERLRRRPDEDDAFLDAAPGQRGVLAEEAIAGMQRVACRSPWRLRSRPRCRDRPARRARGFRRRRRRRGHAAIAHRRRNRSRRRRGRRRRRRARCEWRSRRGWRSAAYGRTLGYPFNGLSWSDRARCAGIRQAH